MEFLIKDGKFLIYNNRDKSTFETKIKKMWFIISQSNIEEGFKYANLYANSINLGCNYSKSIMDKISEMIKKMDNV